MSKNTPSTIKEPSKKASEAVKSIAEKHGGTVTPNLLVDEARSPKSPLHKCFCWDDTEAAEQYRLIQAAALIRRIKVTVETGENRSVRVRAFVNVIEPTPTTEEPEQIDEHGMNCRPKGIYVGFADAMRVDDYRDQVIKQCLRDVSAFRAKYSALNEATAILEAMERFSEKIAS